MTAFLRARCVLGEEHEIATSFFLTEYNRWVKENDGVASAMTSKAMMAAMRGKGFMAKVARTKYGNLSSYLGVDVKEEDDGL